MRRFILMGAAVADAATMPAHWIYARPTLLQAVGDRREAPEFLPEPACPFYDAAQFPGHYATGSNSPYGEAFTALAAMTRRDPRLCDDGAALAAAWLAFTRAYTGRHDGAMKAVAKNMEEGRTAFPDMGADDNQAHCFFKAAVAVAADAGSAALDRARLNTLIRFHQNNEMAWLCGLFYAELLHAVKNGGAVPDACTAARAVLDAEPESEAKSQVLDPPPPPPPQTQDSPSFLRSSPPLPYRPFLSGPPPGQPPRRGSWSMGST